MSADESLNNAENLLARLEAARARLDETQDPDQAIEILQELAELAKEVEAELQRAAIGLVLLERRNRRGRAGGVPDLGEDRPLVELWRRPI